MRTLESSAELGRAALRGGLVTAGSTALRFLMQFGTVVVVARILGPAEYGFAAVMLVFVTLAEVLRGSGLATAVLQRTDLNPQIASRVHYISACISAVIATLFLVLVAPLGQALSEPRLPRYAPLIAAVLLLAGMTAVPQALLARSLRFTLIAGVELLASATGCATAIALATAGFGAGSLAWQAATVALFTFIGMQCLGGWWPGRPSSRASSSPYVRFGLNMAATQTTRYLSQNLDRVLLSATSGALATGLYSQAMQLVQLPLGQLSAPLQRVVLPILSRLVHDPKDYAAFFRRALHVFVLALWPTMAILVVVAPDLVSLVFGSAWRGSGDTMRLLSGIGFAAPLVFGTSWVLVSNGRVSAQTKLVLAVALATIVAIIMGAKHGATGVALAVSISAVVGVAPALLLAVRNSSLCYSDVFTPLIWPSVIAATAGATTAVTQFFGLPPTALLALSISVGLGTTALMCALIRPVRSELLSWRPALRGRSPREATTPAADPTRTTPTPSPQQEVSP